jgi:hypothetical protein
MEKKSVDFINNNESTTIMPHRVKHLTYRRTYEKFFESWKGTEKKTNPRRNF